MYIISKCLLGENCKYDGGNNYCDEVVKFCENHQYFAVCPECAGGLTIPRIPSEIMVQDDGTKKVFNQEGKDVTREFILGSKKSYNEAVKFSEKVGEKIEGAILKAKSPSCGCGQVYDGTFTGMLTEGNGIFADILIDIGIKIFTEKDINKNFRF